MSRDGLLPKIFSRIHPKFHTPSFATIITGIVVAVPCLFMNLVMVTNLCSIGTLFAFVLVCAGVLKLQNDPTAPRGKFKTPYINAKYLAPLLIVASIIGLWLWNHENMMDFFKTRKLNTTETVFHQTSPSDLNNMQLAAKAQYIPSFRISGNPDSAAAQMNALQPDQLKSIIRASTLPDSAKYLTGWRVVKENIPMWIFICISFALGLWCYRRSLSLIPALGLISCLYMMAEIELENWVLFTGWLLIGLIIYFFYSHQHSKLHKPVVS